MSIATTPNSNDIKVDVEGLPDPIFFEHNTPPDVIQSTVRQLQAKQDNAPKMYEHLPEHMAAAGGMAGAVLGGISPVPGGRMVGAGLGATGMGYAGKTIQDFANGIAPSIDRIGDNLVEAGKLGLASGAAEGVFPILGDVFAPVVKTVKDIGAKLGNKLFVPEPISKTAKTSEKMLEQAGAPGLTLGQIADDPASKHVANLFENIAYNALTTRVVNQIRSRQQQGLRDYVSALEEQWGKLPDDQATEMLRWAIKDNFDTLVKQPMNVAMADLRNAAPGRIVNATPLLRDLRQPSSKLTANIATILQKEREQDPATFDRLIDLVKPAKGTSGQALPNLTLDEAMRLKTALSQYSQKKFTDAAGQTLVTSAGIAAKKMDTAIRSSLEGMPDLLRSYDSAQQMYAEGMKTYSGDLVRNVVKQLSAKPGELSNLLLRDGNVDTVKAVREAVGESVWKSTIEPRIGATLLYKSFGNNGQGPLSGTALASSLQRLAVDGTAQAAFTHKTYTQLLDLAKTIEHVTPTPKGAGGVLIQLTQAGAVGAVAGTAAGLASGNVNEGAATGIGSAVTVLLAPRLLGNLVANPKYIEPFKRGIAESAKQRKPAGLLLTTIRQLGATEAAAHAGVTAEHTAPPQTTTPATVTPEK